MSDLDDLDLVSEATEESSRPQPMKSMNRVRKQVKASAMKPSPRGRGKGNGKGRKKPNRIASSPSCASEATEVPSSQEAVPQGQCQEKHLPRTSGLFDFADYLVAHVLGQSDRDIFSSNHYYTFAELGAGYATGTMCAEALRLAFARACNSEVKGHCVFYTEQQDWKREVIRGIHDRVDPGQPCCMFVNTGDVSEPVLIDDMKASVMQLPPHKFVFFAIECDDVSVCSSTPRSVKDPEGKSGASFLEFIAYLTSIRFQDRPDALMVECVKNLDHVRKKVGGEKGTEVVAAALTELGYVGSWQHLDAFDFYLPQSRPRIYGIFLRLTKGFGPKGLEVRSSDLNQAWSFVKRCKTKPSFERLEMLVGRLPSRVPADDTSTPAIPRKRKPGRSSSSNPKWLNLHQKFKKASGLDGKDLLGDTGMVEFKTAAVKLGLTDREVDASILALSQMMKTGALTDWQSTLLAGNIGDSVDRLKFKENMFPCLLPDKKYLLLEHGSLSLIDDPQLFTSLQGIGNDETKHFGLDTIPLGRRQDLAGNAFAANICVSILLALLTIHA
jgi:site-specific DNA-cytosine methylase